MSVLASVRYRRWSIRLRLAVASALVTGTALFLVGWVGLTVYDSRLDADAADQLSARFDAVASAVSARRLADVNAGAIGVPPLRGGVVQVLTTSGTVRASVPATTAPLLDRGRAAAATGRPDSRQTTYAGAPVVLRVAAVRTADGQRVVVAAAGTLSENRNAVSQVRTLLLISWVPAALLAGAGAWLLAGRALAPISRVLDHALRARVSDETIEWWVPSTGDEVERLARVVGELVDQLHDALQDQQKRFADAAHELRTPLTSLRGELDVLARGPMAGDDGLRAARDSAHRLSDLVDGVLVLGLATQGAALLRLRVTSASTVVDAVLARHRRRAGTGVHVSSGPNDGLPEFVCDPTRVEQILDNLVDNAANALGSTGEIRIDVTRAVDGDGDWVVFAVLDDGPGFAGVTVGPAPDEVFERFRRSPSRPTGPDHGLGLGLAIVRELARAHGGDVRAANRSGGGAEVTVRLPVRGPSDTLLSG